MSIILNQIAGNYKVYLFDSKFMELYRFKIRDNLSYVDNETLPTFMEEMTSLVVKRKEQLKQALMENEMINSRMYYQSLEPIIVVIDTLADIEELMTTNRTLSALLSETIDVGVKYIVGMNSESSRGIDVFSKKIKGTSNGLVLGNLGTTGIFANVNTKEINAIGIGFLVSDGLPIKVKLAKEGDNSDE